MCVFVKIKYFFYTSHYKLLILGWAFLYLKLTLNLYNGKYITIITFNKCILNQKDICNPQCLQAGIGYLPDNKPISLPHCGNEDILLKFDITNVLMLK